MKFLPFRREQSGEDSPLIVDPNEEQIPVYVPEPPIYVNPGEEEIWEAKPVGPDTTPPPFPSIF